MTTIPAVNAVDDADEIDLLALSQTLWRGKLWILLLALVFGAIGWAYAKKIAVPQYTARTSVVLENRQENLVDFQNVMSGLSGDQATINTEVEVLRSRNLAGKLVDELDLASDPEFNRYLNSDRPAPSQKQLRDSVVDAVLKSTSIANIRSSYVFTITVVTAAPDKSEAMANTLAELYVQDQLAVKFDATEKATTWLTDRVATLKTELEAAEAKVQDLVARTELVSPEGLDALNRQIKESRTRLESLNTTRNDLAARLNTLESAAATGERAAMALAADDPLLTGASASGDTAAFDDQFAKLLNRARLNLARAEAQVASFTQSIATLDADYTRQSRDLVSLEQLQREAQATRTIYEYFLTRLKETSVQQGIQQPDSRVLSYAAFPAVPSAPRKTRILALSVLLGLIVGSAIVLLREMMHSGFRTGEQVERETGITVMGQVPLVPGRARKNVVTYLVENPTSAAAEAVRNLRTSLLFSNVDAPPQVILSTSALPGEGKTTNAIALAQNFAGMGKKVLLLEGDIRRRVFSQYFQLEGRNGLLALLSGSITFDEAVQRVEAIGTDVILGEESSTNAADVFSSERFANFMQEARARYDIVIIDTPPVLVVPDARIIAHAVDAVLFSIKWDATSRAQVTEALRQFEISGRPVTGCVLSQIDPKGMKRYGYGNRYGAYAAYGSDYYKN